VKRTNKEFGDNGWYTTLPAKFTPEQKSASEFYNDLMKSEPPYQDFWHFVCDQTEIHNGGTFVMSDEWMDCAEDWQKEILERYLSEFGTNSYGCREIEFEVSW
jgi:hypothetical protein